MFFALNFTWIFFFFFLAIPVWCFWLATGKSESVTSAVRVQLVWRTRRARGSWLQSCNDCERRGQKWQGKTLRFERASDGQNNRSVYGVGDEASAPYRECLWFFFLPAIFYSSLDRRIFPPRSCRWSAHSAAASYHGAPPLSHKFRPYALISGIRRLANVSTVTRLCAVSRSYVP